MDTSVLNYEAIIERILNENFEFKEQLINQFDKIKKTIKEQEEHYELMMRCLMPIIERILREENLELKELLIPKIVELGSEVKTEDLENVILTSLRSKFSNSRHSAAVARRLERAEPHHLDPAAVDAVALLRPGALRAVHRPGVPVAGRRPAPRDP